jgi:hypothetical protein
VVLHVTFLQYLIMMPEQLHSLVDEQHITSKYLLVVSKRCFSWIFICETKKVLLKLGPAIRTPARLLGESKFELGPAIWWF